MAKLQLIISMLIFGTIGLVVKEIPLSSAWIALIRAAIAALVLGGCLLLRKSRPDFAKIRKKAGLFLLSGTAMGANWIFLFEAYRYTTVAVATLCYYMAPVFVIFLSPLVLKERIRLQKLLCAAAAVAGVALISNAGGGDLRGVLCGLTAAAFYCSVVLINQFLREIPPLETTALQLLVAASVLLPYVLLTQSAAAVVLTAKTVLLLLLLGAVYTGFAYLLYFSSIKKLPAQTVAILSYLDPVTAVLLSALLLQEPLTPLQICGAVLLLGAMLCSELWKTKTKNGT